MRMSDEPIHLPDDDLLGRDDLARVIASELENLDTKYGAVVAINGPWGSGKTSLIHLTVHHLQAEGRVIPIFFNPWMFSDSDELVTRFFEEVAGQLGESGGRVRAISSTLARYGGAIAPLSDMPLVGGYAKGVSAAMRVPNHIRTVKQGSVLEQRERLNKQLAALDTPILIIIDDIDRLERREIREILKLVRLTGNFPNVVYLLAFDRRRVERAISEIEDDRESNFLDKIVQLVYEVPEVPQTQVAKHLELGLEKLLSEVSPLWIDTSRSFSTIYWDLFAPVFVSLRDVKRYMGSVRATIASVKDRVDFHDLLAMEAIRILRPELFSALGRNRSGLSFTHKDLIPLGREALKDKALQSIECLKKVENSEYVDNLVKHLFQYARSLVGGNVSDDLDSLVSARRIAHRDVLEYYLGRNEGRFLRSSILAHDALTYAYSVPVLTEFLQSIDSDELADVVRALIPESKLLSEALVKPLTIVLLELAATMPAGPRSLFEIRPQHAIVSIVFNGLKSLDEEERSTAILACLREVNSLEGKRMLFDAIADDTSIDGALADSSTVETVLSEIANSYRERSPEQLSAEPRLLWLTQWLIDAGQLTQAQVPDLLSYEPNAKSLLKSSMQWNINAKSGSNSYVPDIDTLLKVLGDIEQVQRLVHIFRCNEADHDLGEDVSLLEIEIEKRLNATESDETS